MKNKNKVLLWGTMLGVGTGAAIAQEAAFAQEMTNVPETTTSEENTTVLAFEQETSTSIEIEEDGSSLDREEGIENELPESPNPSEGEMEAEEPEVVESSDEEKAEIDELPEEDTKPEENPVVSTPDEEKVPEAVKNGWIDQQYFVNGTFATGNQIIDGNEYFFDQNGMKLTGLQEIGGAKKFFDQSSGVLVKNATIQVDNIDYYVDDQGFLHQLEYVTYTVTRNGTQQVLKGYVIGAGSKVDISKINADFIVLNATSGFKGVNTEFRNLADATLKANKLLAMYHDGRVGIKEDAHMEAFHFYSTVKDYIGRGLPILRFMVNENGAGSFWAKEFMDSFYGLTGVKGIIWTNQTILDNGDWESTEKAYTVTTNIESFQGTREEWIAKMKIIAPTNVQEMYRMYNPNSGEHFYTANKEERDHLVSVGWRYESIGWTAPKEGAAVYRVYNPNAGEDRKSVV